MRKQTGVTLIELLVVIFVIGVFVAFFAPSIYSRTSNRARITVTKQKMVQLRKAIVGDPELLSEGEYVDAGFKGDNGRLPVNLMELVNKPTDADSWSPFTKHGWKGPYIRDDESHSFLFDAWGDSIRFLLNNINDTIGLKSTGPDGEWYNNNPALSNDDIQLLF
jgi:prepilin-type N-terminal cleavage/methylation domain-containing protein